ncbi:MAG: four helix bundle protein [Acidobacteriia bacterium]|nr:four helix bundle protein [Terriglobia bacterium]
MGRIESHRDLVVWQKAMDLTVMIYGLAAKLPSSETYRLVTQLTRAAASVPANIAEGHARGSRRDYANFLAVAKGAYGDGNIRDVDRPPGLPKRRPSSASAEADCGD